MQPDESDNTYASPPNPQDSGQSRPLKKSEVINRKSSFNFEGLSLVNYSIGSTNALPIFPALNPSNANEKETGGNPSLHPIKEMASIDNATSIGKESVVTLIDENSQLKEQVHKQKEEILGLKEQLVDLQEEVAKHKQMQRSFQTKKLEIIGEYDGVIKRLIEVINRQKETIGTLTSQVENLSQFKQLLTSNSRNSDEMSEESMLAKKVRELRGKVEEMNVTRSLARQSIESRRSERGEFGLKVDIPNIRNSPISKGMDSDNKLKMPEIRESLLQSLDGNSFRNQQLQQTPKADDNVKQTIKLPSKFCLEKNQKENLPRDNPTGNLSTQTHKRENSVQRSNREYSSLYPSNSISPKIKRVIINGSIVYDKQHCEIGIFRNS
jgi:hypothetical protein